MIARFHSYPALLQSFWSLASPGVNPATFRPHSRHLTSRQLVHSTVFVRSTVVPQAMSGKVKDGDLVKAASDRLVSIKRHKLVDIGINLADPSYDKVAASHGIYSRQTLLCFMGVRFNLLLLKHCMTSASGAQQDREEVIERAREAGVSAMIITGKQSSCLVIQ